MYAWGKGYARGAGDLEMPIGTLKYRKLADPSLCRFPRLTIAKRPNPLGGASDSDAPYLGTAPVY